MNLKDRDYTGNKVFIGLDVHKKKYVVAAACDGVLVKKWTCLADPNCLIEQLRKFFKGAAIESAYEAGFSGFSLHRALVAGGINNKVVNAGSIEVARNDRVKTDKRDAKKIAEQLAAGRLKGIYIPTAQEEERRSLSRGREQVVNRRKRIGNQLKMKLLYLGFAFGDQKISEAFMKWAETLELEGAHKFAVDELISAWREEERRIKRFNEALANQAKKDANEKIYQSIPGVGPISSRVLSNELGDMSRFANQKQLFSCTGLTPGEYSSGEKVRRGHISRQGSARLRCLLVEVGWRAIDKDQSLKDIYRRIASTRGGKIAIIGVARRIAGRIRKCLKEKKAWEDQSIKSKVA